MLAKIEFLTIALKNGEAYVDGYATYGDNLKLWPIIMDTTDTNLWDAYEAAKDDLVLIDQQAGGSGLIVESWMGSDKVYPSDESGKQALMDAFTEHLAP